MYKDYVDPETVAEKAEAINIAIKNIIDTRKGSLPGKPYFGSRLHEVVFDFMDAITEDSIIKLIKEAISKFEPRISIENIEVTQVPEFNRILVTVFYIYKDNEITIQNSLKINLNPI